MRKLMMATTALVVSAGMATAKDVEVLHWWTSGGEAAALNVPILCNDLHIYREILGDIPIYAEVSDRYQWSTMIKRLAETGQTGQFAPQGREITWTPPNWDAHFKAVLTLI